MLERLQLSDFLPLLGEPFALEADSTPPLDLALIECTPLGHGEGRPRQPFSLVFLGPGRPVMPQLDVGGEEMAGASGTARATYLSGE